MNKTIDYYNKNAQNFTKETLNVEFTEIQDKFLNLLNDKAYILDFGCGSGRDSKYFLSKGFYVDAIDGSGELCKIASENAGIFVKCMMFEELNEIKKYDGIWACSSILHLSKEKLKSVLMKMTAALKDNGIIYTSFKNGDFEGIRNGRFFTDFTEKNFRKFIEDISQISIESCWITGDARPGREEEKWLNLVLRKK